ncbi:PAS domain-containing protein [Acuticoccus sp. MNP-M23]|uniref:PAS domain-containing protein n=1 Tax=Acuticoccus sp. MNP-M23 TaxID=3072793 RepID=UPI00281586D0|nr:PAS domain-containing protein [Acuticoccus sp. MNP-M23]WMS45001.1 PAS domain-containing protein [Acuticoccus sp. MNP-M23]
MTEANPNNMAGEPIDLGLIARPDAEAFRYLARSLGARYAGDDAPDPVTEPDDGGAVARLPVAHSRQPAGDPRAAEIIDQVPSAVIVSDAGSVVFLNRAAAALLGHSAASLEAAGGIGALVTGAPPHNGAVEVVTATGQLLPARVTLSAIAWADARAIMVTVTPVDATTGPRDDDGAADALTDLLSANPDPVAIVSRGGHVEAANAAFEALGGKVGRNLHDRLDADGLAAVLQALAMALTARDTPPAPVEIRVEGEAWVVTVGALQHADSACLVFHPGTRAFGGENDPAPLERAADTARRLVQDAGVSVAVDGMAVQALELRFGTETERFFRALLVAAGARAPAGTIIRVTRDGARYKVALDPHRPDVLCDIAMSSRIVLYGLEAGLAAHSEESGLVIAPLLAAEPAGRGENAAPAPGAPSRWP